MYILEIFHHQQRISSLLKIINKIYGTSFNDILEAQSIESFYYIEKSATTKTNKIGIGDLLEFKKSINLSSVKDKKIAIINNAHNLTREAQNSLLKVLEDNDTTLIILALEDSRLVLPTIRSRGMLVRGNELHIIHPELLNKEKHIDLVYNKEGLDNIEKFNKMSLFDKLIYIKDIADSKKSSATQDKEDRVESFLLNLLSYQGKNLREGKFDKRENIAIIEDAIQKLKKNVNARALLEYITLKIYNG